MTLDQVLECLRIRGLIAETVEVSDRQVKLSGVRMVATEPTEAPEPEPLRKRPPRA